MLHKLEVKKSKRKNFKNVNEPSNRSVSHPTDRLDVHVQSNRSVAPRNRSVGFSAKIPNPNFSFPFTSNPFLLHPNLFLIIHGGF